MKTNTIPNSRPQLITLANIAREGVETRGESAGLIHHTAPKIRAAIEELIGKAGAVAPLPIGGTQRAFCAARGAATAAYAARDEAIENAREFCALTVAVLKKSLGRKWTPEWALVGFHLRSLAIPAMPASLLPFIAAYFVQHPEKEIAALDLTAAEAEAQLEAVLASIEAVAAARGARNAAKRSRDAATKRLRQMMVGLRAELDLLLDANDGRWLVFGFNIPGRGRMPEPVEELSVEPIAPGMAQVRWSKAGRGAKFRVSWQASRQEPVELDLVRDNTALLRGLPIGERITISVSARNRSGEAKPTTLEFEVPGALAAV